MLLAGGLFDAVQGRAFYAMAIFSLAGAMLVFALRRRDQRA